MLANVVVDTKLSLPIINRGKVRDIYELDEYLLIIATDRISAFDYVLPDPIPTKGICLTQLSKFWFEYTKDIVPNHLISTDLHDYPGDLHRFQDSLAHRSMLVTRTKVIPIECIVRGYLSGYAWKSYTKEGTVCGIQLPEGLKESDKFDSPLFTPSTKADTGHDINISFEKMQELIGVGTSFKIKKYSLELYRSAAEYARKKGIIIADTKFEFGMVNDQIMLIDEIFTPDSSRFWPADYYQPGKSQPSFDKQFVRDYLHTTEWDKNSSPPHLPPEVIKETQKKYQEAFERITSQPFSF
jgi:phosphoribosylaminoimidazole-succinocarboxamide synthase